MAEDDTSMMSQMMKSPYAGPVMVAGAVVLGSMAVKAIAGGGDRVKVLKDAPTLHDAPETKSEYPKLSGDHPFSSVFKEDEAKIYYPKAGPGSKASMPAITLPSLLRKAVDRRGEKAALRLEDPCPPAPAPGKPAAPSAPLEEWKTWTWKDYYNDINLAARGFMTLGLGKLDAVCIFGFNSPEWFMSQLGCIVAGGISAGIYPTDTGEQVKFKALHSGAVVAVCETEDKAKLFLDMAQDLPKLKAVVVWAPEGGKSINQKKGAITYVSWDVLKDLAKKTEESKLEERIAAQKPGNVCGLIYTSGTTGNPKAVMITHDNIIFIAQIVVNLVSQVVSDEEENRIISYLPLSHVAGLMVDIICPLIITANCPGWMCASFARPYDLKAGTLGDRLRAVRPTMFLGVPRVWEKIAEKMQAMVAANPLTGLKLKIARWSKAKGLEHANNCQLGGSGLKPFGYKFADKKVLSMVKAKLGLDACKFGFTGAAPITVDTLTYFGQLGIQINEVYGMSECTGAVTWSTDEAHVWGSCGWTMSALEVKIFRVSDTNLNDKKECPKANDLKHPSEEEQGEICFRGRSIMMGYMANPDLGKEHVEEIKKKTAEAIDKEGWLHSGDKGCMDVHGMVRITGRYKELIIGAGGENIAPVPIEDNIKKLCPAVSNVMMVGDQQKFNVCVITLKAKGATGELPGGDDLDGPAASLVPGITKISQAVKSKEYCKIIEQAIVATNKDGSCCPSNASAIQRFTILPNDFSVTTDELTATLKLKRSVAAKKYAKAIAAIYAGKENYVECPKL